MAKGTMTATFMVEGFIWNSAKLAQEQLPVAVTLHTDGAMVAIKQPHHHDLSNVALTPKGWRKLADHAADLVAHANRAWADIEAVDGAE